ncbi:hypothetical protein CTI12_AA486930 [Artemisia annua]|uniref:Uncharacterized protein n=1 Tax=Artemisia annua TaxID=35608 RepID=A0A2U1LHY9_ARTAN|nr:hypothetical protein CTI12_AA486930 [Artemisia annua]
MSGSTLAEAYFMSRNLQKKMDSTTSNEHGSPKKCIRDNDDERATSSICCFPTLFKKTRPTASLTAPVSVSSTRSTQ